MAKSVTDQITALVNDIKKEIDGDVEKAVTAGAEVLVKALEDGSPESEEFGDHLKNGWTYKDKYKSVRYVGNIKTVKGKTSDQIPLTSILEYAERSKHKGFIRSIFVANEAAIRQAIINSLKGGN